MIAYLSPFSSAENAYLDMQRRLLSELGFEVRPLSFASLLKGRCFGLLSSRNVVLVHWIAERAFEPGPVDRRVSLRGLAMFASYLLLLALSPARVIYFVHDHAVHDTRVEHVALSKALIAMLRAIATQRVVHDPSFMERYDATYLPHPVYWKPRPARQAEPPADAAPRATRPLRFAILGAIRPYKRIDEVLAHWPRDVPLLVAGKGDPGYVATLTRGVETRGLDAVSIEPRFLPDAEFTRVLEAQDALIIPHDADTPLVSGMFFQAIGRVRAVVARRTPFLDWAARRFPGVYCFDDARELPAIVAKLGEQVEQLDTDAIADLAWREFGWSVCRESYARLLFGHEAHSGAEPSTT